MASTKKTIRAKTRRKATSKKAAVKAALTPYHLPSVQDLRSEIDRVFENFDWNFLRSPARRAGSSLISLLPHDMGWGMPAIDLVENDQAYKFTAELPGMDEKNIEIGLSDSTLIISGEKKEEREEKKESYRLSERRYGSFERSLKVPHGVDTSKIAATFKNGILTVSLPKTTKARQPKKKIAVRAV
jgi:HSP20 family protein